MSGVDLERRLDLARPLMTAFGWGGSHDDAGVDTTALLSFLRPGLVPDDLLAGGLKTSASVALQMAASLRGEAWARTVNVRPDDPAEEYRQTRLASVRSAPVRGTLEHLALGWVRERRACGNLANISAR